MANVLLCYSPIQGSNSSQLGKLNGGRGGAVPTSSLQRRQCDSEG